VFVCGKPRLQVIETACALLSLTHPPPPIPPPREACRSPEEDDLRRLLWAKVVLKCKQLPDLWKSRKKNHPECNSSSYDWCICVTRTRTCSPEGHACMWSPVFVCPHVGHSVFSFFFFYFFLFLFLTETTSRDHMTYAHWVGSQVAPLEDARLHASFLFFDVSLQGAFDRQLTEPGDFLLLFWFVSTCFHSVSCVSSPDGTQRSRLSARAPLRRGGPAVPHTAQVGPLCVCVCVLFLSAGN